MSKTRVLPHVIPTLVSSLASIAVLAAPALAQEPRSAPAPPVDLLWMESLDADRTLPVVRALVPRDVETVVDVQTNCIVVVGSFDSARVRSTLATLETYVERRRARARE